MRKKNTTAPRKIVSITLKYDDGTELQIRDVRDRQALERYLVAMRLQGDLRALASDPRVDWSTVAMQADQRQAHRLKVKATKRTNASGPRKPVTKLGLVAFMEQHEKDNGTTHGWKAAACQHFKIDRKTLKERFAE